MSRAGSGQRHLGEFDFIERLAAGLGGPELSAGRADSIGDDAVVVDAGEALVAAVDTMVEGVHFRTDWSSWEDVAFKLLAVNASDVQAMGARLESYLLALALPDATEQIADAFIAGLSQAAAMLAAESVRLIGGDTTRCGDRAVISLTAFGRLRAEPLLRSRARPGESLWVDGPLGAAAAAVALLERGIGVDELQRRWPDLLSAHRRPVPRELSADALREISACIDVSDGLAADAHHIAIESGCKLILEPSVPVADGVADAAEVIGIEPETIWLCGGDDYAKLATASRRPDTGWIRVGRVEAGAPCVELEDEDGGRREIGAGYRHF